MPFDSAEFFREPVAAIREPLRLGRFAVSLMRALRHSLPTRPAEPVDLAMLRVLEEARGLIEHRDDWVQGRYETLAGARCAVGALRLAANFLAYERAGAAAHALLTGIALERGYSSVETMNDHSPHAELLGAFDAAIAMALRRCDAVEDF